MSRAWTWRHAIIKSNLPATTKHVLLVVSCHMNEVGEGCYPSTKTLAERCSLSERSVCTHLDEAECAGWLNVSRHGFGGQKWARNEYSPAWPEGTESDAIDKKGTEPSDKKALNVTRKGTEPDDTYIDNSPSTSPRPVHPPKAPKGPCGWEEDSGFMSVMEAYQKLNPSRVNPAKAWAVWQEHSLSGHSEQILGALPSFAALHQWKKEGGQFIPNFAKWLADGAWRTTRVALQVSAEELEARQKIRNAGMSALARVTSCQRLGTEPEASDVQAVARMREQQAAYGNVSA